MQMSKMSIGDGISLIFAVSSEVFRRHESEAHHCLAKLLAISQRVSVSYYIVISQSTSTSGEQRAELALPLAFAT